MNARFEVKRSAEGGWFYQLLVADNRSLAASMGLSRARSTPHTTGSTAGRTAAQASRFT